MLVIDCSVMSEDAVLERLRSLLSFYCGVPETQLGPGSRPDNTKGWDSVANLSLIAAVEDEFHITVTTHDVVRLRSLGDLARFVGERAGTSAKGD